jgi:ferritin-like metal-binding protein YciE
LKGLKEVTMAAESLRELFIEELRDMYDGEKQLTRALAKMAKAAGSEDLQAAFTGHLEETEGQVSRLEQVFRSIGEPARGKKCEGIQGIIEESKPAMEELEGALLDAALIAGAQKVEHYEIASYGTLAYFADLLGESQAKSLLGQTLEEEKAADEKLNGIAKARVNREALTTFGDEEDEEGALSSSGRSRGASATKRNGPTSRRSSRAARR